jgi:hypothetical protein
MDVPADRSRPTSALPVHPEAVRSPRQRRPTGAAPPLPYRLRTSGIRWLVAAVVLVGLAVVAAVRYGRDQVGHQPHGPRVAWLLALPPLALVLIAPPALGAFAASRQPTLPPPTIQARPTGEAHRMAVRACSPR